jgi:shikimate kinase/3-dehydroquinate synthase
MIAPSATAAETTRATVFLSGPMGAGKTTLARAFAARNAEASVVDLDEAIAARHGVSVSELFRTQGERAFRAMERAMVLELVAGGHDVVALGGGTVTDDETRRALLRAGVLVTLMAAPAVLAARLVGDASRPLLDADGPDRAAGLARLIALRADAYAECHATLDTSQLDVEAQLAAIARLAETRPLVMPLGARSYPIFVGAGASSEIAARSHASHVVVVCDTNTERYVPALAIGGTRVVLTPGETHKTLAAVESIWNAALGARIDRSALVLAVGGGVVGDLAGFAAATLLRGVSFAQVPTTLLAMVDASVGGKTGFDRAEGKNLIGAFHQPRFVVCDLDALGTLPEREYRSGLAEVVKAAWLTTEADVAALERDTPALVRRDPAALEPAVRRAIATKIDIVAEDEHERGRRVHLNLGHTLGHAIEAGSGYARTHGECVALGMIAALRIGIALGDASAADLARMTALLLALGLPTDLDAALVDARIETFLKADKKRDADAIRFVVPGPPGHTRLDRLTPDRILALARA